LFENKEYEFEKNRESIENDMIHKKTSHLDGQMASSDAMYCRL